MEFFFRGLSGDKWARLGVNNAKVRELLGAGAYEFNESIHKTPPQDVVESRTFFFFCLGNQFGANVSQFSILFVCSQSCPVKCFFEKMENLFEWVRESTFNGSKSKLLNNGMLCVLLTLVK